MKSTEAGTTSAAISIGAARLGMAAIVFVSDAVDRPDVSQARPGSFLAHDQ